MKSKRRASKPRNRRRPSSMVISEPGNGLLDRVQAAKYIGFSPYTLKRWTQLGRIECVKTARAVRYSKGALDRWIAKHTKPAEV